MTALLFTPGDVIATTSAAELMDRMGVDFVALLERHTQGDFGDVAPDSVKINHQTLRENVGTVLSIYRVHDQTLWVATTIPDPEAGGGERYTTIMLAEDW